MLSNAKIPRKYQCRGNDLREEIMKIYYFSKIPDKENI